MLDQYLTIFYAVSVQFVTIIPAVLAVYLVLKLTADLLFDR